VVGTEVWLRDGIWFLSGTMTAVSVGALVLGIQESRGRRPETREPLRILPFVRRLWVSLLLVTLAIGVAAFSIDSGWLHR
jgi:hypothetical protein